MLPEVAGFALRTDVHAHGPAWSFGGKPWRLQGGRVTAAPCSLPASIGAELLPPGRGQSCSARPAGDCNAIVTPRGSGIALAAHDVCPESAAAAWAAPHGTARRAGSQSSGGPYPLWRWPWFLPRAISVSTLTSSPPSASRGGRLLAPTGAGGIGHGANRAQALIQAGIPPSSNRANPRGVPAGSRPRAWARRPS